MTPRHAMTAAAILAVTSAVWAAPAPGAGSGAVFSTDRTLYYDVDVELTGALFHGDAPPPPDERKDLVLYLGLRDGRWQPHFMAWAGERRDHGPEDPKGRRFSSMDHEGTVTSARTEGGTTVLDLDVIVHPDPWVDGGKAAYRLALERQGDRLVGTYEGTFRGKPVAGRAGGTVAETLWPSPVEGWTPLARGEHPRLMVRKADLPRLRERAATETGKRIVERLKMLLGGAEAFPEDRSTATQAYGKSNRVAIGGYTVSHGTGYGMLYQLTGDKAYADLARRAVELSFEGVRDRDNRYSWHQPGGKLRAGPSYAQIACAYDLCYDAWDPAFRRTVAKAIQDKVFKARLGAADLRKAMKEPSEPGLVFNTGGGQHSPHSNHYGAWNGGAGVAILAILGDEGTDDAVTCRAHRVLLQRAERALEVGYGDSGWFFEGHHGGRLNYNTGLAEYLQCLRTAAGLDLVTNFPGGPWLTTKWLYELTRRGDKIVDVHKGIYAGHGFLRGSWSSSGDFSIGFGNVPEAHKPAVLWFYRHVIEPEANTFDARTHPDRAVWALLNWPIDAEAVNPAAVLPKYLLDDKAHTQLFRSGWTEDGSDWVVASQRGSAYVRGPGLKGSAGVPYVEGTVEDAEGGQACIITGKEKVLVADMSGTSGAPVLLVEVALAEPPQDASRANLPPGLRKAIQEAKARSRKAADADAGEGPRVVRQTVRVGDRPWQVVTLQTGPVVPATQLDGDAAGIRIGERVIAIEDGTLRLR